MNIEVIYDSSALFFRNIFGEGTERVRLSLCWNIIIREMNDQHPQALSFAIALSTLGSTLVSLFIHGRIIQELGREGILPGSSFFASD